MQPGVGDRTCSVSRSGQACAMIRMPSSVISMWTMCRWRMPGHVAATLASTATRGAESDEPQSSTKRTRLHGRRAMRSASTLHASMRTRGGHACGTVAMQCRQARDTHGSGPSRSATPQKLRMQASASPPGKVVADGWTSIGLNADGARSRRHVLQSRQASGASSADSRRWLRDGTHTPQQGRTQPRARQPAARARALAFDSVSRKRVQQQRSRRETLRLTPRQHCAAVRASAALA